jgi:hypothetical protein
MRMGEGAAHVPNSLNYQYVSYHKVFKPLMAVGIAIWRWNALPGSI